MNSELTRLFLMIDRCGLDDTIEFANRTLRIYRRSVLMSAKRGYDKPHFASSREFRPKFIRSYLILKEFIRAFKPIQP